MPEAMPTHGQSLLCPSSESPNILPVSGVATGNSVELSLSIMICGTRTRTLLDAAA